jgi:hypothetical protein
MFGEELLDTAAEHSAGLIKDDHGLCHPHPSSTQCSA